MSSPTRPRSSSHRQATRSARKLENAQLGDAIPGDAEVDTQLTNPAGPRRSDRTRKADPPLQSQQAKHNSPVQVVIAGESKKKKEKRSRGTAAVPTAKDVEQKGPIEATGEEVKAQGGTAGVRQIKGPLAIAALARVGRKRTATSTTPAPPSDQAVQQQQQQEGPQQRLTQQPLPLPFDRFACSGTVVESHRAGGGDADLEGGGQESGEAEEKRTAVVDRPAKRARGPATKRPGRSGTNAGTSASRSGPSQDMETQLLAQGYVAVGGADEAGRGPLAGPVVAAVVVLPPQSDPSWSPPRGLNDSKAMTEEEREAVYEQLTTDPRVKWAVSVVDHGEIDRINILQAALGAMRQSAVQLLQRQQQQQQPMLDFLLVDGNRMPKDLPVPARTVVKGDATVSCIAAASCIAKVTRDRLMLKLDEQYPQYGFAQHKGYGVPAHMEAIRKYGPSAVHRRSFEPVKSMTGWSREAALAAATPQLNLTAGGEDGGVPAAAAAAAAAMKNTNEEPSKVVRGRRGRLSKGKQDGEGEGGQGRRAAPGRATPPPSGAVPRRGRPRKTD